MHTPADLPVSPSVKNENDTSLSSDIISDIVPTDEKNVSAEQVAASQMQALVQQDQQHASQHGKVRRGEQKQKQQLYQANQHYRSLLLYGRQEKRQTALGAEGQNRRKEPVLRRRRQHAETQQERSRRRERQKN
ncbi:unnamed protein product [Amoebophrya sp. A120]|nr:unnamed protein product [Amoebophrya sp. A120]|eukprot:GSA120T00024168001.1